MPVSIDTNQGLLFVDQDCTIQENEFAEKTKIRSINGVQSTAIVDMLVRYYAGERMFFRLAMINAVFPYLFALTFPAGEYHVELETGQCITIKALPYNDCRLLHPKKSSNAPYTFNITDNNTAMIMDFRSFIEEERFRAFTDSMFRLCRERNIGNLIIDLRENGGGNSNLGDQLLYHLTGNTFQQGSPCLINNTPRIRRLLKHSDMVAYMSGLPDGLFWTPEPTAKQAPEGFMPFDGNVYVLISHLSFSSAVSFAWTIKELGIGTFIGEETGGMGVCYGNVLSGKLDHSDLQWQMSFAKMYMWRATEDNVHGVLPDVEVPAEQALDFVLELIRKKEQ